MTGFRRYEVSGSKGNAYTVQFTVGRDAQGQPVRMGECSCPAGQAQMMCYHIAAAAAVHVAIQAMRQAAKAAPAAPAPSAKPDSERESLIARIGAAWSRYTPHQIGAGLIRRFGVNQLTMLQTHDLRAIVAAVR
jgi:hypothetical protein